MAERNDRFWHGLQFGADVLPFRELTNKDLSMGGYLNDEVEKRSCCKTIIIRPLLDGYIGQLGMEFKNKIGCGKNTGLQQSATLFFP